MKRNGKYLFTSESVGEGHPDKVADQISDSVLDAIFTHDPKARVDCETLVMQGTVMITGQITTCAYVNIPNIVRQHTQRNRFRQRQRRLRLGNLRYTCFLN